MDFNIIKVNINIIEYIIMERLNKITYTIKRPQALGKI